MFHVWSTPLEQRNEWGTNNLAECDQIYAWYVPGMHAIVIKRKCTVSFLRY